jgi:hypothetical protein
VSTEAVVSLSSALLALVSALVAGIMANRSARLGHRLDQERRHESRKEAAARVLALYRDPLLDAAQTLQSRLFNIVALGYLRAYLHCGDPAEERYARDYTLFAVAEYWCWVEIVRRELRFLDVGEVERNRQLLDYLARTQNTCQTDRLPRPFRIFRGRQRAIAELMMVPTGAAEGPRHESMGYAAFSERLETDERFAAWFAQLSADVFAIATGRPEEMGRLVRLQNDLVDLISFLDEDAARIPARHRDRLALPA